MTPTARYQDLTVDCELHTSAISTDEFVVDLGWCYDSYPALTGSAGLARDAANMSVQQNFCDFEEEAW